jgi:hypothetical protein
VFLNEHELPITHDEAMDAFPPMRIVERRLRLLPREQKSIAESVDPNRPKDRIDIEEPRCVCCVTETAYALPSFTTPVTETADPLRAQLRMLKDDAKIVSYNTLTCPPSLRGARVDIVLPSASWSMMLTAEAPLPFTNLEAIDREDAKRADPRTLAEDASARKSWSDILPPT